MGTRQGKEFTMKASPRNTTDLLGLALLSVGALNWGLLGGFTLLYEPLGSTMVFGQMAGLLAAWAIFLVLRTPKVTPRRVPVRMRR
jgi:uncharacterized membrane protein YuzA (DUF378 family)